MWQAALLWAGEEDNLGMTIDNQGHSMTHVLIHLEHKLSMYAHVLSLAGQSVALPHSSCLAGRRRSCAACPSWGGGHSRGSAPAQCAKPV